MEILSNLILLSKQTDNLYLQRELEKVQKIIKTTHNDSILGEKLRRIL